MTGRLSVEHSPVYLTIQINGKMKSIQVFALCGLGLLLATQSLAQSSLNPVIPSSSRSTQNGGNSGSFSALRVGANAARPVSTTASAKAKKKGKDCNCEDDKSRQRYASRKRSPKGSSLTSRSSVGYTSPTAPYQSSMSAGRSGNGMGFEMTSTGRIDTVFVEKKKEPVRIIPYPYTLPIDKQAIKGAYVLGLSDHKTTHIIFPSKIKVFDAGSADVLAVVPEGAGNVLQCKSADAKPYEQTNMTILLEDGGFYSFLVHFDPNPPVLTLNVLNNKKLDRETSEKLGINQAVGFRFEPLTGPNADEVAFYAKKTVKKRSFIRNVGATNLAMSVLVRGLYVQNSNLYIQMDVENDSQIDYVLDFTKFYIRDKSVMKRVAQQEIELVPHLYFPQDVNQFKAETSYTICYVIPLKTFSQDKVLDVEMYEKGGSRHLRFAIEADVFMKAKAF